MKTIALLVAAWLTLLGCGGETDGQTPAPPKAKKNKDDTPDGLSKRPLKAEHRALVTRLADAIVRKDYKAAFEAMSESYRKDVGWVEFEKSILRYREAAVNTPKYGIWATEDDPKQIEHDGVVELFVPVAMRSKIVEEAAIHFKAKDSSGEEGFWALICWIIEEGGAPRILNYYQDD